MKVAVGFLTGFLLAATIYWSPRALHKLFTMHPPQDPEDYTGPRVRIWRNGVEL